MDFFNWDSVHTRQNSHNKTWIYKNKNNTKIKNT